MLKVGILRLCPSQFLFIDVYLSVRLSVGRYGLFQKQLMLLEEAEGGFDQFTRSYKTFGVRRLPDNSLVFKEWAPAAEALFLTGDFSTYNEILFVIQLKDCVLIFHQCLSIQSIIESLGQCYFLD